MWESCGLPEGQQPWAEESVLPMVREMLLRDVRCPRTSSCGRLFDAVSALGGLCFSITYEGQAAIRLENAQDFTETGSYHLDIVEKDGLLEADALDLFRQAAADRADAGKMARRFHLGLARGLAHMAGNAAHAAGVRDIVLSGGVFNNRTLLREIPVALEKLGLRTYVPSRFPAGDGSIALGQAYWACLSGQ
jgi:hydrogenase maturation protein HypF